MIIVKDTHNYSSVERQEKIVELLDIQERISTDEICVRFGVSEATARRDLESLSSQGRVRRVHGGATPLQQKTAPEEIPLPAHSMEQLEEKRRIGVRAAALVNDGETIFLGAGSTVLEVARSLRKHRDLTVITNSLPVMKLMADFSDDIAVISLGGMFQRSELSYIGHIAEQALAEVRADKVFIGSRAIDVDEGLSNHYLPETITGRAILKAGREIIVVADHTKFGRVAAARLAPIDAIQAIVTGSETPMQVLVALGARGVQVIIA